MPKRRQRNTQKRAGEFNSIKKTISRKIPTLTHAKQNVFKLLTSSVNENSLEFVMLNKRKTFEELNTKMLDKFKDFRNQGYVFKFFYCKFNYVFII